MKQMKRYRVSAMQTNRMNRMKSFDDFDRAREYIDFCFDRGCNLVTLIRPDDTACLFLSADMRIVNQPRLGSYSVFEMASTSNKDQLQRITSHGLDRAERDQDQEQLSFQTLAIA